MKTKEFGDKAKGTPTERPRCNEDPCANTLRRLENFGISHELYGIPFKPPHGQSR